jgi:hypothetical protein
MTFALTKRIAGGAVGLVVGTLLALAAPLTYAQTTTPGVPETGAGGDAFSTLMVLGVAALSLVAGGMYLAYTRETEA